MTLRANVRPPTREPGYDEAEHSGDMNRVVQVTLSVSVRAPSNYAARVTAGAVVAEALSGVGTVMVYSVDS